MLSIKGNYVPGASYLLPPRESPRRCRGHDLAKLPDLSAVKRRLGQPPLAQPGFAIIAQKTFPNQWQQQLKGRARHLRKILVVVLQDVLVMLRVYE